MTREFLSHLSLIVFPLTLFGLSLRPLVVTRVTSFKQISPFLTCSKPLRQPLKKILGSRGTTKMIELVNIHSSPNMVQVFHEGNVPPCSFPPLSDVFLCPSLAPSPKRISCARPAFGTVGNAHDWITLALEASSCLALARARLEATLSFYSLGASPSLPFVLNLSHGQTWRGRREKKTT